MSKPLEYVTIRITKHGVRRSYLLGCRCDDCRRAGTEYKRGEDARRKARSDEAPHGTRGGYSNWGCRCEPCKVAHSVYMKAYREGAG